MYRLANLFRDQPELDREIELTGVEIVVPLDVVIHDINITTQPTVDLGTRDDIIDVVQIRFSFMTPFLHVAIPNRHLSVGLE